MSQGKKLTKDEIIKIFYKLSFFNKFTHEEKTRLGEVESFIRHYPPRSFIITQGDLENSLYVLLKGNVYITKSQSPSIKVATLKAGAVFGEISFLANTPRTTNVICEDSVVALKMNPEMLKEIGPALELKIRDQLMKILIRRLDQLNEALIRNIRFIPEDERVL